MTQDKYFRPLSQPDGEPSFKSFHPPYSQADAYRRRENWKDAITSLRQEAKIHSGIISDIVLHNTLRKGVFAGVANDHLESVANEYGVTVLPLLNGDIKVR